MKTIYIFANFIFIQIVKYMKFLSLSFLSILFLFCNKLQAQEEILLPQELRGQAVMLPTTLLEDGDRIPWVLLPDVKVKGYRRFASEADRIRYNRLKYNVLKVLPYAKLAQEKYDQLHRDLALTNDRKEQRQLVKNCEKDIKNIFNKEIKNMTVSQGKILLKLIDRETGNSTYEVVKELRGGVSAFFYQSLARVFGHNLKNEYNLQEDREIENIIRNYERIPGYY
jgi:hypothetical protein